MSDLPRIKISLDEVQDPRLDEAIDREAATRRASASSSNEPREAMKVPFYYNPIVAYAVFGGIGAAIAWAVIEPSMRASELSRGNDANLAGVVLFPLVGACIGLFVACCDAILSRNPLKALHCGAVGLGIGALSGGVGGTFLAEILFQIITPIALNFVKNGEISGIAFFILVVGRAMAWTFAAAGVGLGQGVALKSKKLILNGLVGGLVGGFIGGMAFDPIDKIINGGSFGQTATLSRFFGLTTIGLAVGLFTGLAESMAKDAWLHMKAGPLAGKQFVIYRDPTVLGSSPKSDIYLFKDPAIEPSHCEVRSLGTRYELRDLGSKHGVFVNGKKIQSRVLEPGDEIRLGETVLQYAERQRKST